MLDTLEGDLPNNPTVWYHTLEQSLPVMGADMWFASNQHCMIKGDGISLHDSIIWCKTPSCYQTHLTDCLSLPDSEGISSHDGRPIGLSCQEAEGSLKGLRAVDSLQEAGTLSPTTTRKWVLPTTWVGLEADSSLVEPAGENTDDTFSCPLSETPSGGPH